MLNDIRYFCALGISWNIYWFLREPVELAEKQTIPAREWLVLFSAVFVFLLLLLLFQSKQHSYGDMFWYEDSTRPKHQVCCDCEIFFFPDFTQIFKLCWKMTFPKNGDDSSGRKHSLLARESSSLVHVHHWRTEPTLHATKQHMNFYNVLGFKYIGRKDWRCSRSWVWPQPCCPRTTALDVDLPISISGRPQLTDDSLSSENHQVMNPFCAIPHLLAKDKSAVSYSSKWSFVKFPTQCLTSQSYKW